MAKRTTKEALKRLLFAEDYLLLWMQSGYSKAYRSQCRHRFKRNRLSKSIQEEILNKCGFAVVVEQRWSDPQSPSWY